MKTISADWDQLFERLPLLIGGSWFTACISIQERASATGLSSPLTCLISVVNCKMKSRCLTLRGGVPVVYDL